MGNYNNKDEMLQDLHFIKEAVKKNNNILKYISLSEGIKNVALFSGIIIIALSLFILWMIGYYGSYQGLPDNIKLIVFTILGVSFIGLVALKINAFLRIARRHKKNMTLSMLMKEVYTRSLLIIMIPFVITIIAFCIYLPINNLDHLIVPILSILVSLLMISFMIIFSLTDFLLSFVWLLISGIFFLFFAESVHPLIILVLTFGIAMLVLYLSALLSISKEKSG